MTTLRDADTAIQFHAVVLYEEDIVIDKVGDQLLIV